LLLAIELDTAYLPVMSVELIPLGSLVASATAVGIAVYGRRAAKRDREADRIASLERMKLEYRLTTRRSAAEALREFDAASCPVISTTGGDLTKFAEQITAGMQVVEPYRQWAATLPLAWRLRIDGQLSLVAHMGHEFFVGQLRRDVAALLGGAESLATIPEPYAMRLRTWVVMVCHTSRYEHDAAVAPLRRALLLADLDLPGLHLPGVDDETYEAAKFVLDAVTGHATSQLAA